MKIAEKAGEGTATLELSEGGTVVAPAIRGGSGTGCLEANGGVIRPAAASADFLSGLTSAKLGAQGLTIEAVFDVGVAQDSANLPAQAGRLVKTGSGTLTFAAGRSYRFFTEESDGVTAFKVAVALPQNAEIAVAAEDDVTVATATTCDDEGQVAIQVGALGTATVTGPVGTGALVKTGAGRAMLSADGNSFLGAIEVDAGLLFFASYAAYGWSEGCLDPRLVLKGGTFAFSAGAKGITDMRRSLVVDAPVNTDAVVIRSETGVKLIDPDVRSGALIKTGAGALVLETDRKCQVAAGIGKGDPSDANGYVSGGVYQTPDFDAFGTPPDREYVGLTVFDGELVLRGTSDAAEFTLKGALGAGFPTTNLTAQPIVTVDHAKVTVDRQGVLLAQYKRGYSSQVTDVYLNITNGAAVKCYGMQSGYRMYDGGISAHLLIDDGELDTTTGYAFLNREASARMEVRVRNGGRLLANRRITWDGSLEMSVSDNGFVGATAARAPASIVAMSDRSSGTISVTDGGVFGIKRLFYCNGGLAGFNSLTLNFDGGVWDAKSAGVDLLFACADDMTINTTGKGLAMNVEDAGVIQVQKAITGDGGLVKTGSGTLVFRTQKIVAAATPGTKLNIKEVNSTPWDYSVPTVTNEMASVKTLAYAGKTVVREGTVRIQDAKSVRKWAAFEVAAGATLDLGGNDMPILVSGEGAVVNGTVLERGTFLMILR